MKKNFSFTPSLTALLDSLTIATQNLVLRLNRKRTAVLVRHNRKETDTLKKMIQEKKHPG